MARPLGPGSMLGDYRLLRELGRGGMGVVFEARHERAGRNVALKVLLAGVGSAGDDSATQRFLREGRAAAAVRHSHLVAIYGMGEQDGHRFVALELLPGGSLADRLVRGPLPWQEAVRFGAQVARGLGALHAAGLVHRDLKPANVLLDSEGRARVSDLGLVASTGEGALSRGSLTAEGDIMGTPAYLSPEQANGTRVDARSDLYSLGATLYALLAGRPPFEGTGFVLLRKHLLDRPPPLRALAPETPAAVERLVLRLLEKDPGARGPGAAALGDELEALARTGVRAPPGRRPGLVFGAVAFAAGVVVATLVLLGRGTGNAPTERVEGAAPLATGTSTVSGAGKKGVAAPVSPVKLERLPDWGDRAWTTPILCSALAYAPDGSVISGGQLGVVIFSDPSTGIDRAVLRSGLYWIYGLAPSDDGKRLLVAGLSQDTGSGGIELWEPATRLRLATLPTGRTKGVAWLDGSRAVAATFEGRLLVIDVERRRTLFTVQAHPGPGDCLTAFAVSKSRRWAVTGSKDHAVTLWDLSGAGAPRAARTWSLPDGATATCADFDPDGEHAFVGDDHGNVTVFPATPGAAELEARRLEQLGKEGIHAIAVTPDGKGMLVAWSRYVQLRDPETGGEAFSVTAPSPFVGAIACSPDGLRFVVGGDHTALRTYDMDDHPVPPQARPHGSILALALLDGPGPTRVVAGGTDWIPSLGMETRGMTPDGSSPLWTTTDGTFERHDGHGAMVTGVVAAGPHRVVSVSFDSTVLDHDLSRRGTFVELGRGVFHPHAVAVSPDGTVLTTGEDGYSAQLYKGRLGEEHKLEPAGRTPGGWIWVMTWGLGTLVTGQSMGTGIGLWDAPWTPTKTYLVGHTSDTEALAFEAHTGRLLSGSFDRTVKVWDLEKRKLVSTFEGHAGPVFAVAWILDGRFAVSASTDGTIRGLEPETGREIEGARVDIAPEGDHVRCLAVRERTLFAGTARGLVLRFRVEAE